jgi:AcrR family transcriptional regulator
MTDQPTRRIPKFRRRAEARPEEVLDAALDLFIEQGFAKTRVEDIAKRAGLSKGAVYLYFPSKEQILEALVKRALTPIAENVFWAISEVRGDPRPTMKTVLRMLAGRLNDPRTLAIPKLILREVIGFPELARMYRREVLDRVLPLVEATLARGIKEGYFRPVDPHLTIRSIIGPMMLHVVLAEVFGIMPEGGIGFDQLVENHITILFDGLSAPAAPEGGAS